MSWRSLTRLVMLLAAFVHLRSLSEDAEEAERFARLYLQNYGAPR